MSVPEDLRYTENHEWLRLEGNVGVIGITDHAQEQLGDVVFVELPDPGTPVDAGSTFGSVESVKAVSDLFSPVSGEVAEVNPLLSDKPELVNSEPYGDAWLVKIKLQDPSEVDELLTASAYESLLANF